MSSGVRQKRRFLFHSVRATWSWIFVLLLVAGVCITLTVAGPGERRNWLDAQGNPLPFKDSEELEVFLQTANVVEIEEIPEGVTDPQKITLEQDGLRVHAILRTVDISQRSGPGREGGIRLGFRDNCVYECAAYELDQMLQLGRVPPVVTRKIKGKRGTVQLWIEQSMTEKDRKDRGLSPPNQWRWIMQAQLMRLFDALIYNDDRNSGNLLIDSDWELILIDHTRAFRKLTDLPNQDEIRYCHKDVWERLRTLSTTEVKERLSPYLTSAEIKALLERRAKLVEHFDKLLAEQGENILVSF